MKICSKKNYLFSTNFVFIFLSVFIMISSLSTTSNIAFCGTEMVPVYYGPNRPEPYGFFHFNFMTFNEALHMYARVCESTNLNVNIHSININGLDVMHHLGSNGHYRAWLSEIPCWSPTRPVELIIRTNHGSIYSLFVKNDQVLMHWHGFDYPDPDNLLHWD